MSESELHTDLEAAFNDAEKEQPEEVAEVVAASSDKEFVTDESAPEQETEQVAEQVGGEQDIKTDDGTSTEAKETAEAAAPPAKSLKAPAGWTPQQREKWSKVPADLQESIVNREKEMADAMANTAQSRKTHDRMSQMAQSYAPIMAAEGVTDPVAAAEGLFQTVSQLRMGNAQQKAQTIADLVKHYGVGIEELDTALVGGGNAVSSDPQQAKLDSMLEEKMAPFNHMMTMLEQAKAAGGQQKQAQAQKSVETFAQNAEFLGDVRNDMADLIDMAHSRGVEMPLQEAYNKAIALNPEITKVLEQRKISGANQGIAGKRRAASTLSGRKTGVATPKQDGSIRGALSAAWDGFD